MNRLISLLFSLALLSAAIGIGGPALSTSPGLTEILVLLVGIAATVTLCIIFPQHRTPGVQTSGISVEVWVDYIIKRFWKDNSYMKAFFNDDQYVVQGKTVHIPQPGSKPSVTKNPSVFPLTAAQRTDTEVSYDLDFYVSTPSHITSAEAQEVSYDKMDSVMGDHMGVLNERIAEEHAIKLLNGISGTASTRFTSGAAAAAYIAGQTSTRKVFMPADLKAAGLILNSQNVPKNDRNALLDSNALDQLTTGMDATQYNAFNQYYNAQTGQIGRLYGFDIFERSSVAVAAAALSGGNLAVNAYGAAVATDDLAVNLCWQKDAATRAMGEILVYEDLMNPLYAGDIYNASIRFGGRRRRSDNSGVVAIAQAS